MSEPLLLDPKTTALVLIDLQKGVTGRQVAPYDAPTVLANASALAERFRSLGSPVVLVRVSFGPDGHDRVTRPVDQGFSVQSLPEGWDQIVPEIGPRDGDIVVTKRQWGAFYGTDLDLHLRRRGIETIVLGGIATSIGVDSTARDAYERNYAVVLAEDAMADMSAEAHAFTTGTIFPRLGRVRSTEEILTHLPHPQAGTRSHQAGRR